MKLFVLRREYLGDPASLILLLTFGHSVGDYNGRWRKQEDVDLGGGGGERVSTMGVRLTFSGPPHKGEPLGPAWPTVGNVINFPVFFNLLENQWLPLPAQLASRRDERAMMNQSGEHNVCSALLHLKILSENHSF